MITPATRCTPHTDIEKKNGGGAGTNSVPVQGIILIMSLVLIMPLYRMISIMDVTTTIIRPYLIDYMFR